MRKYQTKKRTKSRTGGFIFVGLSQEKTIFLRKNYFSTFPMYLEACYE
jgi:hypothetical protein